MTGADPRSGWLAAARRQLPGREADWLFQHVVGAGRGGEPDPAARAALDALLARRLAGEPLAYLLGSQPFRTLELQVDARVLIPRPETEELVDHALALAPRARVDALDLGTGSGAIALALATERPEWRVSAVESNPDALALARANGAALGAQVAWYGGEWFAPVAGARFHLVVANPPYVAEGDPELDPAVAAHEPAAALLAGADGLSDLRRIAADAPAHLHPGGHLLVEHGHRQGAAVRALFTEAGLTGVATERDLAGRERFTAGRRRNDTDG